MLVEQTRADTRGELNPGTLFVAARPLPSMEWKLFANLAETVGDKHVTVDVGPGATFGEALDALLDAHPELRSEVLNDDDELRDHIRVLHNGDNPFVEGDGRETELAEGDELALFPPVSGG